MDKDTTPTPALPLKAKYRGAVVEDLQLPPAYCLEEDAPLGLAIEKAFEREFDQLPILNDRRRPVGYLYIPKIMEKFKAGKINPEDPVSKHTTRFSGYSQSHPYTIIHPLTPLEELEDFFKNSSTDFALVTDAERKWVMAVVTQQDLETFVKRRG